MVRAVTASRPAWLALLGFGAALALVSVMPELRPTGPMMRYVLEVVVMSAVIVGGAATWWAMRRGRTWDAELWPALLGGIAAFSLLAVLHATAYAPGGLQGDQAFRTETITRFADTWQFVDFTYDGLPAFYAPAYFWVLGASPISSRSTRGS